MVDLEYGCGAHSDTPPAQGTGSPLFDPYDDGVLDVTASPQPTEGSDTPESGDSFIDFIDESGTPEYPGPGLQDSSPHLGNSA